MTVTLEIPSKIESAVRARAQQFDLAVPEYLLSVLEADIEEDYSLSAEDIESIQQGLDEFETGDKGISLEDFDSKMQATFSAMKQQKLEAAA